MKNFIFYLLGLLISISGYAQVIECQIDPNVTLNFSPRDLPPPPTYFCNQIIHYRIVFDCDYQYYLAKGRSISECENTVNTAFDHVAPIYLRDFGISLENGGVVVNTNDNDGYTLPSTTSGILNEVVTKWNNQVLQQRYRPNTVILISGRITNESLGGFSYQNSYCSPGISTINGLALLNDSNLFYKVIAHELAHTLGASHDNSCSPAYLGYLMSTTITSGTLNGFSPCSILRVTQQRRTIFWSCSKNYECCTDLNSDGITSVNDIFYFLQKYFSLQNESDYNNDGNIGIQDIFDFLNCYFQNL